MKRKRPSSSMNNRAQVRIKNHIVGANKNIQLMFTNQKLIQPMFSLLHKKKNKNRMRTLMERCSNPSYKPNIYLDDPYHQSSFESTSKRMGRTTYSACEQTRNKIEKLEEGNIKLLMHNLEYDFRESKHRLKNVFNNNSNQCIIKNNEPLAIDVLEDLNCVYKIESKDQLAPLKISMVFNKDDTLCFTREKLPKARDIKVQVFLTDELKPIYKPNMVLKNKMAFVIDPLLETSQKFETDLFLIFSSVFGCSITVRAKFPDDNNTIIPRYKTNYTEDRRLDHEEFADLLFSNQPHKYDRLIKEIDTGTEISFVFKKIKYQQMLKSGIIQKDGTSFLEKNKQSVSLKKTQASKATLKSLKRAKSCLQKKRKMERQNRIKKIFLAKKWEIIKEKRMLMKRKEQILINHQRAAIYILKLSYLHKYIKKLHKDYDQRKFEVAKQGVIFSSAVKIFMVIKRYFKKRHPDVEERTKLQLRNSIKFGNIIFGDTIVARSQEIIQDHLSKTSVFHNFTRQSMIFTGAVRIIQKEYKKRYSIHVERIRILTDNWKGEIERQIKYKTKTLSKKNKNTKRTRREIKALNTIPEEFRNIVIKKYYQLALIKHKLRIRETENYLIQHYEENITQYDNEGLIKEIEDLKRKLFGKPEMTVLEIDFKIDPSPKKSKPKHTVGFGATTESIFTPDTRVPRSKKVTKLFSKNLDEIEKFSDDKSVPLYYPDFEYLPSNKELLFLIEKARDMKDLEDVDKSKEVNRKSKFATRNMMRVDHRSTSSMSHYS
ncbi:unnamed protein product [Moneuplotes crassus]|uniref:Uncharacterized protein n=1 Tax=Euplotes crassus TaxID=5936 RepID=A0AAD1Y4J0_EUPCR|nr:unnamed protein product [Moneuplotes crassus]